ncbi:type II secretion system F family protein [Brevundimonas diminuta]|uniref:type II secretion system F family protein n=1 Tax=Brevundimonas TaxID=41275 RepID=UPI0010695B1C|nr:MULTISPECIES: type II secretion system F family protein [Brevundimonas]MCO8031134.1 type II secretion system F family protein [Brevundimonas diminuta]QBQ48991.1 type II secretion system F family protein [Brevundimonas naejangsanensis]
MTDQLTFQYEAAGRDGRMVKGMIGAADEALAMRRLAADGLTVVRIRPAAAPKAEGRERGLKTAERVLVLRQMALMLEAGVSLLEALDTVAQGMQARKGRRQFQAAIAALRRGESLGDALEEHAPGFPDYVYAMARVGEASGRIAEVLKEAAEQMAYEDRLQRDFANAMTYPAFLCFAGVAAVGFIFTQVVPRFGAMIGDDRENIPAMSRWVLQAGEFANANLGVVAVTAALVIAAVVLIVKNAAFRERAYTVAHGLPVVGPVIQSREIASWARLTAFALNNGVPLLSAAALSRAAVPIGPFRQGLDLLESDLKAGMTLDASLGAHTRLEAMDLSLLRAGQKSGAVGAMFGFMADNYEARLRDRMKRMTSLLEPMAIAVISIVVGFVALSLVLALSSVYEGVV